VRLIHEHLVLLGSISGWIANLLIVAVGEGPSPSNVVELEEARRIGRK
jgi:hypothetical protein